GQDCDSSNYAVPEVAIGPLADVGADLVAAIDGTPPAGLTPTLPALEGAISYAQGWAMDHPDHASVVVLVTDGFPTQCGSGPEAVTAVAQNGYEMAPFIKTYVIGVGDVARFNLDNYARGGGTREAYLTDEGDISSTFVDALNNITNSDIACEYHIPTPADPNLEVDYDKVLVVYTPEGDAPEEVPSIGGLGDCSKNDNGGWYYDNPDAPTKISVCPCTCSRFGAGRVDVRLGCKPRIGLR
ncbi:MAG TPA: hypothetical protein VGP93_10645, partial [Polyangiaceae bacterium]|nr:hypothetical protein [Polyangiaceae bacterium]